MASPGPAAPMAARQQSSQQQAFGPVDWVLFMGPSIIWGSSFLLIAMALEGVTPGVVTFGRVALGCAALWVVKLIRRPAPVKFAAEDRKHLVVLSALWVAVPFTLFPIAEQHISSAVTGLLNGATPIFVGAFSLVFTRSAPPLRQLAGIGLGFVGVVLISAPSLGEGASQAFGVLLVLAATFCYGIAINLANPLQARYGSLAVMRVMLTIATVLVVPVGIWGLMGGNQPTARTVWPVVVLGVVGTGFAYWIMAALVGRVGPVRASFVTYLIPVVALILGVVVRSDRVSAVAVVGIAFVTVGALIASRRS